MFYITLICLLLILSVISLATRSRYRKLYRSVRSSGYEPGRNEHTETSDLQAYARWAGRATFGLLTIALILTGMFSFYTQDPGEATVVRSVTGSIAGSTSQAGMHLKAPWNSTEVFDIRNQRIEMFSNDGGQGADGAALDAPLKGGANASVSITVVYSIRPDSVQEIYTDFRTQEGLRENALKSKLRDIVRNETAKLEPLQVKENRAALGGAILESLEAQWDKYGIVIDQVNLGDIKLDASTEEAISRVINAQQGVEQARADLERAAIAAEITKTEAQATADQDQIIRCGATSKEEVREIDGKETKVTIVTPRSNEDCENRLNEQVLTTKYIEALRDIADGGNLIVVPEGFGGILNLPTKTQE